MAGPCTAATTGVAMANRRRALVVEGSGADAAGSVAAARERTGGGALAGEVGSGAERSPLGGEHDGPAVGVGVEGLERCRDPPEESGVEEVVRWTPQLHHPDETLVLHFDTGDQAPPFRGRHRKERKSTRLNSRPS